MDIFTQCVVPIICGLVVSSGFWAFINSRLSKGSLERDMLVGLGHDRIISLGMKYIERGYITSDEYENLYHYLYRPYKELGGNGSAKRIMDEVNKLEVRGK